MLQGTVVKEIVIETRLAWRINAEGFDERFNQKVTISQGKMQGELDLRLFQGDIQLLIQATLVSFYRTEPL